jgi:molybdate transport system substrate-binding protein
MKTLFHRIAFLCFACSLLLSAAQAQETSTAEIIVAAAADLSSPLQEISTSFQKQTGVHVKLSFGASGTLTQEIQQGAPFDVFLSADMDYPRQLIASGKADPATLYQYATGKLVLWIPADSKLDVQHGMNILLDPSVKKIAIANPQHAPYGRAAVAALKHAGIYDRIASKLVLGENVSQAAQFVESGNAQAGFIALAHALAPGAKGKGKYWEVPSENYPPLAQGAVVLSHSQHKKEAAVFVDFLKTRDAAAIFEKYGFTAPRP